MVIYLGNFLSKHGFTESLAETFVNQMLNSGTSVKYSSDKLNKISRVIDLCQIALKSTKKDILLIDTFSTNAFYFSLILGFISRIKGMKYCPILRGGNLPIKLNNNRLADMYFSNSHKIIAPSQYLFKPFHLKYNNVICIPNFIPIDKYKFTHRKKVELNLLWVRSFDKIYNPFLVLDLAEMLFSANFVFHITMVGPDKDGTMVDFKRKLEKKQLESFFTITGKLEKNQWIELSEKNSVFINTTDFDNHPVSIIEAMALGFPIVSTNVGGVPYLIENNENGLLFEKNNKEEFYNLVLKLNNNPELCSKLSLNARKAAEKLDWKEIKKVWDSEIGEFY
jgi:glycosyltransferase involved in cell wall biosynthesis